jgi:hypothetical protein
MLHDDDDDAEGDEEASVSDFADVLQVPLDVLLGQFAEAGMLLSGPDALVTMEMKENFLAYLKRPRIIN